LSDVTSTGLNAEPAVTYVVPVDVWSLLAMKSSLQMNWVSSTT